MSHFQKSRHGEIFQNLAMVRFEPLAMASSSRRSSPWAISKNLAMARFLKTSPWRDFQNLAMARFSKLCYGEISKTWLWRDS